MSTRGWPDQASTSRTLQRARRQRDPTNMTAREVHMALHARYLGGCAALALAAVLTASPARAQDAAALNAEAAQNDWPTYHGTYKSYHYSGLDQINAGNVKDLGRSPGCIPRSAPPAACSRSPLAVDGVLYYSGSYSRRLCARRRDRQDDLGLYPGARRGPGRQANPLALQPRHRASGRAISMSAPSTGG